MEDTNKEKRTTMWWAFVVFLMTVPLFVYIDNKQMTKEDLSTIYDLVLLKDSEYDPGGGKSSPPAIKFHFTTTDRGFELTYDEYQCVSNEEILTNFKKGDTLSISLRKRDSAKFYTSNWFSKYSKVYGLVKNGKNYLSLDCRNKVSDRRTSAATTASIVSAAVSLFFALIILKPKTKYEALGQFPLDPVFIVLLTWIILYIALRRQ